MCKLFWRLEMEILPDNNQDNYWCIIRKITWKFRYRYQTAVQVLVYIVPTLDIFQKYFYLAWQHGITAIIRRVHRWQHCVGKRRHSLLLVVADIWQGQNIFVLQYEIGTTKIRMYCVDLLLVSVWSMQRKSDYIIANDISKYIKVRVISDFNNFS